MPKAKDLCHPETVRVAASHQAEAEKIAAELAAIAATSMLGTPAQNPARPAARTGMTAARSRGQRTLNL